jgi:hypothetical protein
MKARVSLAVGLVLCTWMVCCDALHPPLTGFNVGFESDSDVVKDGEVQPLWHPDSLTAHTFEEEIHWARFRVSYTPSDSSHNSALSMKWLVTNRASPRFEVMYSDAPLALPTANGTNTTPAVPVWLQFICQQNTNPLHGADTNVVDIAVSASGDNASTTLSFVYAKRCAYPSVNIALHHAPSDSAYDASTQLLVEHSNDTHVTPLVPFATDEVSLFLWLSPFEPNASAVVANSIAGSATPTYTQQPDADATPARSTVLPTPLPTGTVNRTAYRACVSASVASDVCDVRWGWRNASAASASASALLPSLSLLLPNESDNRPTELWVSVVCAQDTLQKPVRLTLTVDVGWMHPITAVWDHQCTRKGSQQYSS